jgi:hypothetical protein
VALSRLDLDQRASVTNMYEAGIEYLKIIGGLGGIISIVVLIYDRFVRSKPLAYLIPHEFRVHLRLVNTTNETIIIDSIEVKPRVLEPVWGSDTRSEVEAAAAALYPSDDEEQARTLVIRPSAERSLPLQFRTLDKEGRIKIRFRWRNTRTPFLLARHVSVYTSFGDLRILKEHAR